MDWNAVGAIGELLGAFLVAGTLIYLVIQVRQNTRSLDQSQTLNRVAADEQIVRLFNEWREFLIQDSDLASIYLRGIEDLDALEPEESLRFNYVMTGFIWTCWQALRLEEEGLFSNPNTKLYKDTLAHPGVRAWYVASRDQYGPLINSTFDPILDEIEESGYTHDRVADRVVSSALGGPIKLDK